MESGLGFGLKNAGNDLVFKASMLEALSISSNTGKDKQSLKFEKSFYSYFMMDGPVVACL